MKTQPFSMNPVRSRPNSTNLCVLFLHPSLCAVLLSLRPLVSSFLCVRVSASISRLRPDQKSIRSDQISENRSESIDTTKGNNQQSRSRRRGEYERRRNSMPIGGVDRRRWEGWQTQRAHSTERMESSSHTPTRKGTHPHSYSFDVCVCVFCLFC